MALSVPPVVQEEPQPGKNLRIQLAAAVRSINWTYAIFWSISRSQPGVLTWKDGFYNGEIKTRKIASSIELTAEELSLQRSEQLRELYEFLQSGTSARPVVSLSPENLGDAEWYYVTCMTYAFRPGQGYPGRCFARNEQLWLCNAHLANSKAFPRALLAKSASIQTLVCIPFMGGVLELGTTASVIENQTLVNQATRSFKELNVSRCTEDTLTNNVGDENNVNMLKDLDENGTEAITDEGREIAEIDCLFSNNFEQNTKEFDDLYWLWEELDVQRLKGSLCAETEGNNDQAAPTNSGDSSRTSCFISWTRSQSDELVVPIVREPQKLLKKVVTSSAWTNNDGESSARISPERGLNKHVMTERRRREKLNEMFHVLKSSVPTIRKTDKASILSETIIYLKELEQKVKELEYRRGLISIPDSERRPTCHDDEITRKRFPARTKRKKASNISSDMEMEHHGVLSKDIPSTVNVTVIGTEVLLEVRCQWKESLMTHVFNTIKNFDLDIRSMEASTPNSLMVLKVRAQSLGPEAFPPGMIMEALRRAIANH